MGDEDDVSPRIVVVGPCAAGKTTLVNHLRPKGYNIRSCAQEHSYVARLWQLFSRADVLIFLDADLATIARRQGRLETTEARLDAQHQRLSHARSHCDFYLRTDDLTERQVADAVEAFFEERGLPSGRSKANGC